MGRQKGDGARSKNRPSSSSLAASLLPSGVSSVGFGGYTGSSRLASPQTSDQDTLLPSDVDGELAQHLRRLGRKDPTTKMKALASLSTLIKQRSAEEVTQIVPQWAFEYKRLLHDYNREVRRATHDTMTNLVVTVGRGLAPHLKSLMGPWWFSQFDPVSEISQAARRSLQAAFPASERRLEALILCASEIFLFLDENLKLTPQAMSDKATPMDELEEMHQRVVSSSLLALATFIDILLGMQSQRQHFDTLTSEPKNAARAKATAISYSERMFSTHKYFLEFFKSQSLGVRSATYSVITCFIKHIPDAFNEGNMKTLSSAILGSFQEKEPACHSSMWDMILIFSRRFPESWSLGITNKIVVPRFWCFLRNGCYGSQQVSYPNLVSFLDSIPPKAIVIDRFFPNFFHNLWAGRNPYHSLSSDRLAFFKALGECFLWGINNASRYFEGVDAISHFQLTLVENVLVTLLWRDYFLFVSQKIEDGLASGKSSSIDHNLQHVQEKPTETVSIRYPISYLQDLGKCIIEILLEISLKSCNLLSAFCAPFLKECMEIFQQEESGEHVEQIINFMLLLEQHAVQKGEKWPLVYLAGPLVVNSFPLIKSLDLPASVKLLSVVIGIFGPREIVLQFFLGQNGEPRSHFVDEDGYRLKLEHFMQVFNNDFVPWCLHGNSCSTSARLDLLLALLDVELFHDQWFSILTCATELNESSKFGDGSLVVDRIDVLAMLMEKVRGRIVSKNLENQSNCPEFSHPEHWQHKLLNSAAVSVSRQAPPFHSSHAKFLRAVLGGSAEDDNICFLSQETVILVFEEILTRISLLLTVSPFSWARHASSLILCTETKYLMLWSQPDIGKMLKIAKSAFDVLKGSFFCLKALDGDFELVPRILAAIFFSDWEGSMISQVAAHGTSEILESEMEVKCFISKSETAVDDNSQKKLDVMYLGESAHAFRCQIDVNFWKSLNSFTLQRLQYMLVKVIRFAVFGDDGFGADNLPAVCSKWVMDMVGPIFRDHREEQLMLDQLLCVGESWPLWVAPLVNDRIRTVILKDENTFMDSHGFRQRRFVSFVVNLVSILGVGKVIAGSISEGHCPPSTAVQDVKVLSSASYSRAWIAAEILCTWKWHEGSALSSFLPLLCEYARVRNYSPGDKVFDSLVCILLDGALADRSSIQLSPLNVWTPSDNEVDSIQDPFLRALVSLLLGLFIKDNIWGKGEAGLIFEFIVNKLFIGMAVSRSCLRILPYILNILVQPLRNKSTIGGESGKELPSDTSMDEKLNNTILSWLERALCIPPLILWQPEQLDSENWVHVAIACYPLNTTGGMKKIKMVSLKNVRDLERKLLYGLFQKQRSFGNLTKSYTVSAATQIPLAASSSTNIKFSLSLQTTLANLTAVSVGYCWQDFSEDDWNFVMSHLHRWTESAVLVMEEMAENLDGTIIRSPVSDNATILSRKLEEVAQIVNPFPVDIARIALFIFSLYLGLTELGNAEGSEILMSLRMGQWDRIKDRIFEDALRLFFATGVAESIASCLCEGGGSIIASTRHKHPHFWELVAVTVINSPCQVRKTAMHSVELWGLCKGPISSLYAILFSSEPITCLQFAAYMILSTEPVCTLAITKEVSGAYSVDGDLIGNQECDQSQAENVELPSENCHFLVDEISCMIEKPPIELLEMDLVAQDRVNFFLAWALLLTHLQSLPPLSPAREKLVQYLQDSTSSSTILDCLFQNIPLKLGTSSTLKKKDVELSEEASCAATASKRAITECSLLFSVESLWPVGTEQMASLSGAIYGLMLRVLPAYVRNWFNGLRDRSMTCAIENFTKACCSLHLLADELSQIKGAVVADENFSISVNKSTYEVTATYKKEETGMDLVIRLPSCYPLSPVDVDCTRNLGISEVKQRKWMLSMAAFVRNQNGALTEAIKIWKSNFDKEFEGIEECPICYSIIHTTNHNLPRMACKTCKHKFHSACLYKWFSTSHKSTCPLCQTPF